MTMADKIVVMRAGRVEQIGAPLELYERPQNAFVGGFIGSPSMNQIEGEVVDGDFVTADGLRLPLPEHIAAKAMECKGKKLIYGIRPEHLFLGDEGVEAIVDVVEPSGAQTDVFLHFGANRMVATLPGSRRIKPGDRIAITPNLSCVHVFDGASGARIAA